MRNIDFSLCRSWLFIGGPDARAETASCGADAVILEFEDFTPPEARPAARAAAPELLRAWKAAGAVTAVRINPLGQDGGADLAAAMAGAPDVVMLPKVRGPGDISELAAAVVEQERLIGRVGGTRLVPNIESAAALFQTREIAAADPRVIGCLLASEDLTADLGAPRTRAGGEIAFARAYFHAACVAAGVLSIDYPYTFADEAGLLESCAGAKALGYRAKSLVAPAHAAPVNTAMMPSAKEVAAAQRTVAAFDAARAAGQDRVLLDGHLVEVPTYLNARALLARAAAYRSP
ncbi:MAG TPA: aldolase/citrate lyase family protein [Thermohalobaculum sp.]|nr:aldolase/citrate lyase family protein [Thermohalobaculum sp.]